jgi:hypothetical protein
LVSSGTILTISHLGSGVTVLGDNGGHIFRSVDYGATWSDLGVIATSQIYIICYTDNGIVVAGDSAGKGFRSVTAFVPNQEVQPVDSNINLNQGIGNYDLFLGHDAPVLLESFIITMPNAIAGGALTKISVQTNDATPQVIIDDVKGDITHLVAENQLSWTGRIKIGVGKKIQLSIYGGATGVSYICSVDAQYRQTQVPGYLS